MLVFFQVIPTGCWNVTDSEQWKAFSYYSFDLNNSFVKCVQFKSYSLGICCTLLCTEHKHSHSYLQSHIYTSIMLILKAHYSIYICDLCVCAFNAVHLQQMASLVKYSHKSKFTVNQTEWLFHVHKVHINIPEKNDVLVWLRTWVEQVISLESVIMSRGALFIVCSLQKWIPLYIWFTLNIWIGKQIDAPLKLSTADQVEEERPPGINGNGTHMIENVYCNWNIFTPKKQ